MLKVRAGHPVPDHAPLLVSSRAANIELQSCRSRPSPWSKSIVSLAGTIHPSPYNQPDLSALPCPALCTWASSRPCPAYTESTTLETFDLFMREFATRRLSLLSTAHCPLSTVHNPTRRHWTSLESSPTSPSPLPWSSLATSKDQDWPKLLQPPHAHQPVGTTTLTLDATSNKYD